MKLKSNMKKIKPKGSRVFMAKLANGQKRKAARIVSDAELIRKAIERKQARTSSELKPATNRRRNGMAGVLSIPIIGGLYFG